MRNLNRRAFLGVGSSLILAACSGRASSAPRDALTPTKHIEDEDDPFDDQAPDDRAPAATSRWTTKDSLAPEGHDEVDGDEGSEDAWSLTGRD